MVTVKNADTTYTHNFTVDSQHIIDIAPGTFIKVKVKIPASGALPL